MREFRIGANEAGVRLDKQLLKILNNSGRGFVYKMLRKKNITLNDKKASGNEHLCDGDIIKIYLSDETFGKFSGDYAEYRSAVTSEKIIPMIVYENEDIILLSKPCGMLSQKADINDISLNELCISYLFKKGELNDDKVRIYKPSVCNRLDRNTSGMIIFVKNYNASVTISGALDQRTIHKYYLCVVSGRIDKEDTATGYLYKDSVGNKVRIYNEPGNGRSLIRTAYRPLKYADGYTLLEVELITGKSHQIRAQMAALSHPLIGDFKYGDMSINNRMKERFGLDSQFLHSYRLTFPDDKDTFKELAGKSFEAMLPQDKQTIIDSLFN